MQRRILLLLLCVLISIPALFPMTILAEEEIPSATRNPSAPKYDPSRPDRLEEGHIVASSFILMERATKEVLLERNADVSMYPASTSKVLTALMALMLSELDDEVTISANAVNIPEDASRANFKQGEVVSMEDALYGLMLPSGNDAAIAIAEHVSGENNVSGFVQELNEMAQLLGCTGTNFTNPHGYHDDAHYTTARDLAIMVDAAMDHPDFRTIFGASSYRMNAKGDFPARRFETLDRHMISGDYQYNRVIGGKTGTHSQAGYCLVEVAEYDGTELIAVILFSSRYDRWTDTKWLFEYGFTQYKSVTPEQIYLNEDISATPQPIVNRVRDDDEASDAETAGDSADTQSSDGETVHVWQPPSATSPPGDTDPEEKDADDLADDDADTPIDDDDLLSDDFDEDDLLTADDLLLDATPAPTIKPKEDSRIEVEIKGFDLSDPYRGVLKLNLQPRDPDREVFIRGRTSEIEAIIENISAFTNVRWTRELRAPVEAGDAMGIMTFFPDNEEPAEYDLIAERSIKVRTDAPPTLEEIEARVLADPSPFPPFSLDWVLPPVLMAIALLLLLRYLILLLIRRLKGRKKLPKPKKRYFS